LNNVTLKHTSLPSFSSRQSLSSLNSSSAIPPGTSPRRISHPACFKNLFHGILRLNLTLLLLPPSSPTGGKELLYHPTKRQHLNNERQKRLALPKSILNQHLDHFKFPSLSLQLSLVLCRCHARSHGWLCMDPIKAVSLSLLLALDLCLCHSHNHSQ